MRKKCYICHRPFVEVGIGLHNPNLCPACEELNTQKRNQTSNLSGKVALVTGGRFNIGYEVSLKLLRAGANTYITTRFPADATNRFSKESDFENWKENLHIIQCDFRNLRGVLEMIEWLRGSLPHLDILINNAAQTIRRPYEYYRGLVDLEVKSQNILPSDLKTLIKFSEVDPSSEFERVQTALDRLAGEKGNPNDFPIGEVDMNGWQLDLREKNTWNLEAPEISPIEFLEVQTVNSTVPFMLCSYLKDLFLRSPNKNKHSQRGSIGRRIFFLSTS